MKEYKSFEEYLTEGLATWRTDFTLDEVIVAADRYAAIKQGESIQTFRAIFEQLERGRA